MRLKKTNEGFCYLNIGCGTLYSPEWNNIDLYRTKHVTYHNIRKPLPYPSDCFDAVYSSHVLEHLTFREAAQLVGETRRILKSGGVFRLVVPDLEKICEEYLKYLNEAANNVTPRAIMRYNWIKLELIDQMVRDKLGGLMLETLKQGEFDAQYVQERCGDQFADFFIKSALDCPLSHSNIGLLIQRIRQKSAGEVFQACVRKLYKFLYGKIQSSETHKWMYDRVSLKILLEENGFNKFKVSKYNESGIPYWEKFNLDVSQHANCPRKPDSIYVEVYKPDNINY